MYKIYKRLQVYLLFSFIYSTFSIVAIDLNNGQVGSAGASCIGGSIIISDIHPGIGAIHTQSYWSGYNQIVASDLMDSGLSPDEIIDYLVENDVNDNPLIRQYGIVDIYEGGRNAIGESVDPEIDNRVQRLRVDLPGLAPELVSSLKEEGISFDKHPPKTAPAGIGILGNL